MAELITDIPIINYNHSETTADKKVTADTSTGKKKKLYIESYGCQMNFADSEIVTSVMMDNGYDTTSNYKEADVVFLNTCSIRENAETKVRNRLKEINSAKIRKPGMTVGILGCMAERLKTKLLEEEKMVDIVAGPDAYRDLPNLLIESEDGQKAVNVFLSRDETYADITPVRLNTNGVTAFISIMRGCDNMCSFCVVPYTRGRERSRDVDSIVKEATDLFNQGYREVTLLGQNVDSYKWESPEKEIVDFAQLLDKVASVNPLLRVRFSTSHPKDITDEVLYTMKKHHNICKNIHLPVQSGSNRILELMNRTYSREWYMQRIDAVRSILGTECGLSTDVITGFCTETEDEHKETLSIMEYAQFDFGYYFAYSERPNTPAAKKYTDDIPQAVKLRRVQEVIDLQHQLSMQRNLKDLGKVHEVLVEGFSKRSNEFMQGRNSANKVVIFPADDIEKGQYVNVLVDDCSFATLKGKVVK
ncbi:MAG: tRNA (N6-isopentenyl adenosine(37)-C2)-methylthiotransferase MiaB [Bacteroidota bacterium]|nr:tRNA (N6-isopentenyl adenosine(37)-C2)-methylthiotransferase MiaB [Bacteroidota bacterium]